MKLDAIEFTDREMTAQEFIYAARVAKDGAGLADAFEFVVLRLKTPDPAARLEQSALIFNSPMSEVWNLFDRVIALALPRSLEAMQQRNRAREAHDDLAAMFSQTIIGGDEE